MNSWPRSNVMTRLVRRLWPDTMLSQILVLLAVSGLVMVVVGAASFWFLKERLDSNASVMNSHLVSVAIAKLNETPAGDRREGFWSTFARVFRI